MRRIRLLIVTLALLLTVPASSLAATRALLIACSDFTTQPSLGNAISGNLQMIGSALLGASPRLEGLSIEDGTIGTPEALAHAVEAAFSPAAEEDLSILYLCTHGVLSSSDDGQAYLLLGDGRTESMLTGEQLCRMVAPIQGEKLLILDACYSGAIIGRGEDDCAAGAQSAAAPFLADPSIHVLTSASGCESSWYFDSDTLASGAISYFASALSSALGLYGTPEADLNADGKVTLSELHRYLNVAVPSSSSQLLSAEAASLTLPSAQGPMLSRPLTGFTYGESLLLSDDPTLDFSFTVTREAVVQYRLIDYDGGRWNWETAQAFLDDGENGSFTLSPGRKTRTLSLPGVTREDSGYLMLQIFSLSGSEIILCSERLIAVQPAGSEEALALTCPQVYTPASCELPIEVQLGVPAEVTVSVFDQEGALVRRLCTSQLTRPTHDGVWRIYWDGRDDAGAAVESGLYTVAAEAIVGFTRQKAASGVAVAWPQG